MNRAFFRCSFLLICSLLMISCGATKSKLSKETESLSASDENGISQTSKKNARFFSDYESEDPENSDDNQEEESEEQGFIDKIISYAKELQGTQYKYGGASKEGFDCSGLVFCSFLQQDIVLPRSSREMALKGELLSLAEASVGDLLFFITDRKRKIINHVGLITEIVAGNIHFIHSTTSKGVMISSMSEEYWSKHFVAARRIL